MTIWQSVPGSHGRHFLHSVWSPSVTSLTVSISQPWIKNLGIVKSNVHRLSLSGPIVDDVMSCYAAWQWKCRLQSWSEPHHKFEWYLLPFAFEAKVRTRSSSPVLASAQGLGVPLLILPPTSSTLLYVFTSNCLMKLLPCHYWEFFSVAPLSIIISLSLSNAWSCFSIQWRREQSFHIFFCE